MQNTESYFLCKKRFLEHASEVLGLQEASKRGQEAGRSVQENVRVLQDAPRLPGGCSKLPGGSRTRRKSHGGPRRCQEVPWRILASSQEALRRLQDAPTKLLGGSQEARGGSQVVSGSVVFKGSKVLGRVCISKFQGHLHSDCFFKISGPFMFLWFVKTQDSEHVVGSCRPAGL